MSLEAPDPLPAASSTVPGPSAGLEVVREGSTQATLNVFPSLCGILESHWLLPVIS